MVDFNTGMASNYYSQVFCSVEVYSVSSISRVFNELLRLEGPNCRELKEASYKHFLITFHVVVIGI